VDVVQRFLILLLIYGTDVPAEQNENIIFVKANLLLLKGGQNLSITSLIMCENLRKNQIILGQLESGSSL